MYEEKYKEGTLGLAKAIAESDAESIVGGGDTLASIRELKAEDKFTFISTAGGAMLDFLANETLPGIEALEKSK
jgi:3-phosphoglycerate kinase